MDEGEFFQGQDLKQISVDFTSLIREALEKTETEAAEHAFAILKNYGRETITVPLSKGNQTNVDLSELYSNMLSNKDTYVMFDVHTHPQDFSNLPSPNDLSYLLFLQEVCLEKGIRCSPIGGVLQYDDDGTDELATLVLYQAHIRAPVNKLVQSLSQLNSEIIDENSEEYTPAVQLYLEIVDTYFNTGMIIYEKSEEKEYINQKALTGFIEGNDTTIDALLDDFCFVVNKL